MSVLGGMNGGVCLYCGMQMVAWLESTRQQNCFYWKENTLKLLQRKQKSNRPITRSLSPSDGGFVGNHEEPGVDSLAKQREVLE